MPARLRVRVTPRGGRDAIERLDAEGVLHVRVSAPPADGAANESVVRMLAKHLGVSRSNIRVVGGAASRVKTLQIDAMDDVTLRARLSDAASES